MSDAALRMDRMYGWQTGIYDATRRPYLLGRDRLIESLAPPQDGRVLEIGCGTGRNLIRAARRWPHASYYGFDVSPVMIDKARQMIARADLNASIRVTLADAVTLSNGLFGEAPFERIFFSYTLSMIPKWEQALDRAAQIIPPGGCLMIADFGDQRDLPWLFRKALNAWLSLFDVHPRIDLEQALRATALRHGLQCDFVRLYRGYAFLAALRRCAS